MATDPKKLPALGALPSSAFAKTKKPKASAASRPAPRDRLASESSFRTRPAPAFGVTRRDKPSGVKLFERYGLVFDPEAEDDPITQKEREALLDLYRRQTGLELDAEDSVRDALERSGLLRSGRGVGPLAARRPPRERLSDAQFASAADALDYLMGQAGESLKTSPVTSKLAAPLSVARNLAGLATGTETGRGIVEDLSEPFYDAPAARVVRREVGRALGDIDEAAAPVTEPIARGISSIPSRVSQARFPSPRSLGLGLTSAQRLDTPPSSDLTVGDVAAIPFRGPDGERSLTRPLRLLLGQTAGRIGDVRFPSPQGLGLRATSTGRLYTPPSSDFTLGDISAQVEEVSINPEKYVSATSDVDVAAQLVDAPEWLLEKISEAKRGATIADLALVAKDEAKLQEASPFTPQTENIMRVNASRNGWDNAEWDGLSINDQVFRAVNKNDKSALFLRNAVRQVGEIAAFPAGVKAIIEASANAVDGDPEEGKAVIESIFAPYVRATETYQKDGFWAAFAEFVSTNPIDAVFIFSAAARTGSRAAGASARAGAFGRRAEGFAQTGRVITAPGVTGRREPLRPVAEETVGDASIPRGPGMFEEAGRRAAERRAVEERNRVAADEYAARREAFEERGEMEEFAATVPIGVTGRGLVGSLVLQNVKAPLAKEFPRYAAFLSKRMSKRDQRLSGNVAQGEAIEIRAILERALGSGVDEKTRARAVFELIFPAVDYDGVAITPAYVADFFRAERAALQREMSETRGPARAEDVQFDARLDDAIARYDAMESVRLDPEVSARLRAEAKAIGEVNDQQFARMMGVTIGEAKRANYIRVIAMDRSRGAGLEAAAQARKASRNAASKDLRRSQKRLKTISKTLQRRAAESGWGSSGPARSRLRFRTVRSELVAELRRAEDAARRYGDEDLAASYRQSRAALVRGRVASRAQQDAVSRVIDDVVNARVVDDAAVERLPERAREAYEEFVPLARTAEELTARRLGALELAGVRKTTSKTLQQAEDRVIRANEELESYSSLPNPDPRVIAKREENLQREMAKRDAITEAEALKPQVRAAKKARDAALRRVINESNKPVISVPNLRAVLDESETFATVEVKGRKDLLFTISRAREEVLDEFIARVEALDQNPVLHLVQTPDFDRVGKPIRVEGDRMLEVGPRGFISKGRFENSEGYLFVTAQESARVWDNLLSNTAEVSSARVLQQRLKQLIIATSIPFRFSNDAMIEAKRIVDEQLRDPTVASDLKNGTTSIAKLNTEALASVLKDPNFVGGRVDIDANDWVVLNIGDPAALRPSDRLSYGTTRASGETFDPGVFTLRTLDERTLDPNAKNDYYLMPRSVYNGIQDAIRDEAFAFRRRSFGSGADRIVRFWRTLTLNVLPRTAINNTIGSTILAIQAGAGPRAFWYAANALAGRRMRIDGEERVLPVPPELRQRYYEQLTDPISRRRKPGDFSEPTPLDYFFSWAGWWMNSMRTVNGLSEDFGRLAVWYHRAYPEAIRDADGGALFARARRLNAAAVDALEGMARRDPDYRVRTEAFMQQSFDFLGDLHKGGKWRSRVRIMIPFWQWYAHMLKLTFFTMPVKYPGRALFIQMIADIGREYQRKNGVMLPWGQEFVPFAIVEAEVGGRTQEIVEGVGLGGWWPQATTGVLGDDTGDHNVIEFLTSSITPVWSNTALIVLSMITAAGSGSAREISNETLLTAARDQYGLEIEEVFSEEFLDYSLQKLMRMFPLNPTVMSQSGRAATALPGFDEKRKEKNLTLPEEFRQKQRADVLSLVDDWRANLPAFLLKATIGLPINYVPGRGPMTWQRQVKDYEYQIAEKNRRDKAIADSLRDIHEG